MDLYIEKETAGEYGLIDTFLDETITLTTKTTYIQDITAIYKGFTNSFAVKASPNNTKLLGYFGFTEQFQPALLQKRAKLYLDGMLFKEGIITIEGSSWVNSSPSLFQLSFSDGKRNLPELVGEDTLAMLSDTDGNLSWTTKVIQNALQGIQTATGGVRWFVPLASTERIFTIYKSLVALPTDNISYDIYKPITSENVLLPKEIRPAMFVEDILRAINNKYDIDLFPTLYNGNISQLTDLSVMCVAANVAVKEQKAKIAQATWNVDTFREERFDIKTRTSISAFELNYLGYGAGASHDATFGMEIKLTKTPSYVNYIVGLPVVNYGISAIANYINSVEVWEVDALGVKLKKLNYSIVSGGEVGNSSLKINIGLDVFFPPGSNTPSTLIKPLIAVFVSADNLSEWLYTNVLFDWNNTNWFKVVLNNQQPSNTATSINLFKSLPEMKVIDFVKSIYTMFAYKRFKTGVYNDFFYTQKTANGIPHRGFKFENDLTPFADLSKVSKKTNTKYDGYNLKHFTSEYQQNKAFALANGMEWGQLKYPLTGKPKAEFLIETKFTAPTFSPVASDADTMIYTFYPFGTTAKLNESQTRYIYDTIIKELPIFYHNGIGDISTPYAFVDTDTKVLKSIGKYHKISHKSNRIFTGVNNYISSLFNIVSNDFVDQNTLYVQGYKEFVENTLSGRKLIHAIDLTLPSVEMQKFDDNDEVIIKETKYTILESNIGLTDGKTKLTLLNK